MRFLLIPAIVLAGAVFGYGQTGHAEYTGQHWVGLLVSASCNSQAKAAHGAAAEAMATTTGRTTTPPVDASGTRGQASVNETADRTAPTPSDVPRTGDVFASASGKVQDRTWPQARKQQPRSIPRATSAQERISLHCCCRTAARFRLRSAATKRS